MGSCKEDAFNDIRSETLQLIRIHTETDSACYYIIKDYDCLTSEPLFIKLDDAHLSDFLFSLTVFMNSKSFSAYPYMVICLRPFYHSESGKIIMQVDEELKGQIHTEMMKAILKFEIRVK